MFSFFFPTLCRFLVNFSFHSMSIVFRIAWNVVSSAGGNWKGPGKEVKKRDVVTDGRPYRTLPTRQ